MKIILKKGTNINNFKTLNSYLKNKQISSINNQITEKFQAIENIEFIFKK